MPYLLISTEIRLDKGPTIVGDEYLNKNLADYLEASLTKEIGNEFSHYVSRYAPRIILDMLEVKGYKVVSSCGVGQTCVWTLYAENPEF